MASIQTIPGNETPAVSRPKINTNFANLNEELATKANSSALTSGLAGKSDTGHSHSNASGSTAGFMSAADKTKLDGLSDTGGSGDNGWTPVLSIVTDGARRVVQIVDWVGGEGTKPSVANQFVGASGIVSSAAAAVDIRGAAGSSGSGSGDMLAANNLSELTDIVAAKTKLLLQNVSNTSDANKPVSTAQAAADTAVQAAAVQRSNHTGTQAIATVSGLQAALDAKQATLVSATNIKTINGASVLGSGDLTVSGGGGGLPALNATWTTGDTNFVVEGDSIGDAWDNLHTIAALTGKTNFTNVAVSGSYLGATDGSGPGGNLFGARYTDNVYPKRPAANGGTAGITKSILFLIIGTNNNYDLALTRYATYVATAKSHGFTVIVCTIFARTGFHASGGPTPYTVEACRNYALFNRGIYDGTVGAHYVVPLDTLYFGTDDLAIEGDNLHLSSIGNARAYAAINRVLLSDGTAYDPIANLFKVGRVVGAAPGCIPSNDTWGDATHYWRAAQGPQITSLEYAADMAWNTELAQCANLELTGDVSSITPANQFSGPTYELWVKHNGHEINWAYPIVFGSISQTPSANPAHWDYYKFKCKDSLLTCVQHETDYSFVTPPEPGAIFQESFLQTGADAPGVPLHNTQADVLGIEGETWFSVNHSIHNLGPLRKFDENRSAGGGTSLYDHGLSNNIEIKLKNVVFGNETYSSGFVFKAGSKAELFTNTSEGPQWIFLNLFIFGGVPYIGLKSQGSGGTGDLGGISGGTTSASVGITPGDDLRVTIIDGIFRLYVDGDPVVKVTATLPAGVASNTINGLMFSGGGSIERMVVNDLAG